MQEFNQIMEEIHKAYLESNDTNKKHIIKILLTFHKIITDKDNDKNLESIERHLTRKVIYQDFADKKKLDLLSLRNCFVHKQFKDIDVLDYSRLIWATFENVSSEIKYDELRNFLAYLFRIRIESEEEQNKQEKLVKTFKKREY